MAIKSIRLYYISITCSHVFLIEQYGFEYRIYQSWRDGFDLDFWTNRESETMCEPGQETSSALLDAADRQAHIELGVSDDRESILSAKKKYGELNSLDYDDVMKLFHAISYGFYL